MNLQNLQIRKIKFRGKRFDNNEWVYGYLTFLNPHHAYICDKGVFYHEKTLIGDKPIPHTEGIIYRVIPETIGQYINLNDKSGVEIYEGDICDVLLYTGEKYRGIVIFKDGSFCLKIISILKSGETNSYDLSQIPEINNFTNIEVVGNIYDNTNYLTEGIKNE